MKKIIAQVKELWLWIYRNLILKYWSFRYRTTLMSLARLTLLVLAKETVVPMVYWILVLVSAFCQYQPLSDVLEIVKVACIPSTAEIIIAILAVVVLLIVARFEFWQERRKVDLFTQIYVPYTDKILEYMNVEHYHAWTYSLAVSGNTMVHEDQLDRWDDLILYVRSRVKHSEYKDIDDLYDNLAIVVEDILSIINMHCSSTRDDGMVTIEKFYKRLPYNPHYNEDLHKYDDVVMMLADLVFEQTRLLNLMLKRMRAVMPEYKVEVGKLMTDNVMEHNEYREDEESEHPYPGLNDFMTVRASRNYHLGNGVVGI